MGCLKRRNSGSQSIYPKGWTDNCALTFEPYGAVLVVFNKKILKTNKVLQNEIILIMKRLEITGEWTVNFDSKWGGPESKFPELMDWSTHPDEGIKYYSGSAVYKKNFS